MAKQDITKALPAMGSVEIGEGIVLAYNDYQKLLQYILSRIEYAQRQANSRALNMNEIDTQLLGSVKLKGKDKARAKNNQTGKSAKVTDVNLALGQSQIDTAVTALLDMLVPTDKMYEPFGLADQQSATIALTKELNKAADRFSHIVEYHKMLSDCLRYNLGGCEIKWTDVIGTKLVQSDLGEVSVQPNSVLFSGNSLKALDMRNTFYDNTVAPEECSLKGGYAGYTEALGISQLNELIERGQLWADYIDDGWQPTNGFIIYNFKPNLRTPATSSKDLQKVSYDKLFGITGSPDKLAFVTTIYAKLRAKRFGLPVESDGITIWEFKLIGERIVYGKKLVNAHGRLPIVLSSATCDSLDTSMIGYSETLIPMQNFASFLINAKQRGYKKQLYGVTFYDKNRVDMREVLNSTDDNEFEQAYVPVDTSDGQAVGNFITNFNDAPDTSLTMQDLGSAIELMQTLLPTDSRQSLANLSRVSQWQAERTVRETDKRTIKIGRLLSTTLINPIIYQSVYNVLQFKPTLTVVNDDGTTEEVATGILLDQDFELNISSALRGLDKDLAADRLRDVINSLIQVPNISADINIIGLVRYWSTLMGLNIDLAQFKVDSPFDKLTPEQKQAAYQLLMAYVQQQQAMQALPNAASSLEGTPAAAGYEEPSQASMAVTE